MKQKRAFLLSASFFILIAVSCSKDTVLTNKDVYKSSKLSTSPKNYGIIDNNKINEFSISV